MALELSPEGRRQLGAEVRKWGSICQDPDVHVSQSGWDTVSGVTLEGWAGAQHAGPCRLWADFAVHSVCNGKPLAGLSWAGGTRGDPVHLTLFRKQLSAAVLRMGQRGARRKGELGSLVRADKKGGACTAAVRVGWETWTVQSICRW